MPKNTTLHLSSREAAFLRMMAKFCVDNHMPGNRASERLDKKLAGIGAETEPVGPIYDIFASRAGDS